MRWLVIAAFLSTSSGLPSLADAQEPAGQPSAAGFVGPDTLRVWQSFSSLTGFAYEYGKEKDDVGWGDPMCARS